MMTPTSSSAPATMAPPSRLVGRHRVQRDQNGHVTDERIAEEPLPKGDCADNDEHGRGVRPSSGEGRYERSLHDHSLGFGEP